MSGFLLAVSAAIVAAVVPAAAVPPAATVPVAGITHAPQRIHFSDNDQVSVVLSSVDINRLSVVGDKIEGVDGPPNYFVQHNEINGDDYLMPLATVPFTLFLSTVNGHHLSLLVLPQRVVGKTLLFYPLSPDRRAVERERASVYSNVLVGLIRAMTRGTAAAGYAVTPVKKGKTVDVHHTVSATPVMVYTGARLAGVVYRLRNRTHRPLTLSPTDFYQDGVRAIALSRPVLGPDETGFLYEIRHRSSDP